MKPRKPRIPSFPVEFDFDYDPSLVVVTSSGSGSGGQHPEQRAPRSGRQPAVAAASGPSNNQPTEPGPARRTRDPPGRPPPSPPRNRPRKSAAPSRPGPERDKDLPPEYERRTQAALANWKEALASLETEHLAARVGGVYDRELLTPDQFRELAATHLGCRRVCLPASAHLPSSDIGASSSSASSSSSSSPPSSSLRNRTVTIVDLSTVFELDTSAYYCPDCHCVFEPQPISCQCWPATPSRPQLWFTWRLMRYLEVSRHRSPKTSFHAQCGILGEVHRIHQPSRANVDEETMSSSYDAFVELLRRLQDPRKVGVPSYSPGVLCTCPGCAYVPGHDPLQQACPSWEPPNPSAHRLDAIVFDATFKSRIANAGATQDAARRRLGLFFEDDILVDRRQVEAARIAYEEGQRQRKRAPALEVCSDFRAGSDAARSAPLDDPLHPNNEQGK